jgi:hypothetical protein
MRALRTLIVLFMLGAGLAHSGCARRSGSGADAYAWRLRSMVGREIGPLEIKSIEADGEELVFTLDGPEGWRRGTPSYAITAFFLEGFCKAPEASGYLVAGRALRIDTFEDGKSLIHGPPVHHGPHA